MRIGFAFGCPDLIAALNTVKNSVNSYTLDRMALSAAQAAVEDTVYMDDTRTRVSNTREITTGKLKNLGFAVLPSRGEFRVCQPRSGAGQALFQQLRKIGAYWSGNLNKPRIHEVPAHHHRNPGGNGCADSCAGGNFGGIQMIEYEPPVYRPPERMAQLSGAGNHWMQSATAARSAACIRAKSSGCARWMTSLGTFGRRRRFIISMERCSSATARRHCHEDGGFAGDSAGDQAGFSPLPV